MEAVIGWSLYWVSSDGEEDCFVVARNSRSAARVERDYCGFDSDQVTSERVVPIPSNLIRDWLKRRGRRSHPLPWYSDGWLLKKCGARFRERDDISEILINDVVYSSGPLGPYRPRLIGRRFIEDFRSVKKFQNYGHEDRYSEGQMALISMLGMCVARCQEIEHLIAHSFILGALVPSERRKGQTITQMIKSWKRKTLGQMIRSIEEGYEIEPLVQASFHWFVEMRNKLVHGLTTDEQYDIDTHWGQSEMVAFLTFFELVSRPIRQAFRSSLYASIEVGNQHLLPADHAHPLTKKQRKLAGNFGVFFMPRMDDATGSGSSG